MEEQQEGVGRLGLHPGVFWVCEKYKVIYLTLDFTGFRLYGLRINGLFGFVSVIWSMDNPILVLNLVESGAAYRSRGFEDEDLGSSPCLFGQ